MKNLIFFLILLITPLKTTENTTNLETKAGIIVYQINSEWNDRNTIKNLEYLRGCKYVFGYLEEQPPSFKEQIKSVPAVFITKDGSIVYRYQPGLSMKPEIGRDDIQKVINSLR